MNGTQDGWEHHCAPECTGTADSSSQRIVDRIVNSRRAHGRRLHDRTSEDWRRSHVRRRCWRTRDGNGSLCGSESGHEHKNAEWK